jgi:alpha-beta hydrolase superfamily lysophospholipase
MGGSIVIQHALTSEKKAAAYIVTSPLLQLAFDPPAWRVTLGRVMLKIWPGLVQPASLDSSLISHVEEEQQKYAKDPLVHGKITPAAFFGFIDAGKYIMQHAASLTVPVLALHGSGDKITSHKATRKWAESNSEQITYHELSGLYHEMHNEMEREELFQLELNWIKKTIQ